MVEYCGLSRGQVCHSDTSMNQELVQLPPATLGRPRRQRVRRRVDSQQPLLRRVRGGTQAGKVFQILNLRCSIKCFQQ